ncbi:DUF4422 domain-containing protein [[Lactobacillus] timonensis]|uniref:DUF4422 domain-containing protein n=1 Tax=[Lactobacillus] timonensis TaxID=1970790 RepID=UPI000C842143|nr:DUF4422 domain-containing protein [[Lactobacillus] timonensis]
MTVYVITHKKFSYDLPRGYTPLLVGADYNQHVPGYLNDNLGENISSKNKHFCELTGLYWIWKNTNDQHVGLVHYRRYFFSHDWSRHTMLLWSFIFGKTVSPISEGLLTHFLEKYDWVVGTPDTINGESLGSQYKRSHYVGDLQLAYDAIKQLYPEYLSDFDQVIYHNNKMSSFNMFYTSRKQLNKYCQWLFDILFKLEPNIKLSNRSAYQQRVFGFLSERLFNVWLHHQKDIRVKYLSVFNTDNTNRKIIFQRAVNFLLPKQQKKWFSN